MIKKGLGRGLEALIPETSAFSSREGDLVLALSVDRVVPNPDQPRRDFDEEGLERLAESIQERGVLQPILVRRVAEDRYEIVAGERRWRAAMQAGFRAIPAIVRETSDEDLLTLALIENLVREDLNPMEEARAFQKLQQSTGWTQEEIGRQVGKSRVHVANTLRLLQLPEDLQAEVGSGVFSAGHARTLLACETEEESRSLAARIRAGNMTVREAEASVAESAAPLAKRRKRTVRSVSPEIQEMEERLRRVYGTPVQIHERKGRGRVSLEFYSLDDITRLTDLLLAAENHPASLA
ncbi:MAG: ParB/RepB/Spo0J family partition protein [Gemmatimonadota bacterium]|jgi:ParB family chromosome partitioning protein|nr:chromosome partitioning protein ParB [Gemmatimonadota bacterium]MDP6529480.1 ParB/RepB/Spo0J family partition protein [Gemmatimonadota bacterium]